MLKMGVVGMGIGGAHGAKIHAGDVGELTAICDSDPEKLKWRLESYAEEIDAHPNGYVDLEEMLSAEKLDGVVISTPSGTHHQLAAVAARHGVNSLMDKPLDINVANIDAIDQAVTSAGVLCGVNYQMRFNPGYRAVKKAVDAGAFGKVLMIDFRLKWFRDQDYYDSGGWRGTWAMDGGGSLMNQGAHPMDLLVWLAGKPVKVRGDFGALNHEIETEDWAAGIVEFESGVRSVINTTTNVTLGPDVGKSKDRIWMEVHGTEGSAFLVDGEVIETNVEALSDPPPPEYPDPVADFMAAIIDKRPPEVTIEQGRWSVQLIQAVYESARRGETITF